MYRAIIEGVDDSERRYRYRVRIFGIHPEDLPADALPDAEFCAPFSSKQAGDIPHYERGDTVWVMFEGGDPSKPVVVGGWITNSAGIPDVPLDQIEGYKTSRRRWSRVDRNGNSLELSELAQENHARMRSGAAEVAVSQVGNRVVLKSANGRVEIRAPMFHSDAKQTVFSGESLEVIAKASPGATTAGICAIKASFEGVFYGGIRTLVGVYAPKVLGVPFGAVSQSVSAELGPSGGLQLGFKSGHLIDGLPTVPTAVWRGHGVTVEIVADTSFEARAPTVKITGVAQVEVESATVKLTGTSVVQVDAPQIALNGNVQVSGSLSAATIAQTTPPVSLGTHLHVGDGGASPPGNTSPPLSGT